MTDRKMITKQQYNQGLLDFFFRDGSNAPKWDDLQDAPKHTDEEYVVMQKHAKELGERLTEYALENVELEARIKELEAKVKDLCEGMAEATNEILENERLKKEAKQ